MADWDILVEIRNTCLVGVRDRIGFKSGQAVVKHTDGELVVSECVPVWLLYVFTGLLSQTPADCVIVSLSRALTLWWVGGREGFSGSAPATQRGANLWERTIDEPVNHLCDVMWKDSVIYNQPAGKFFFSLFGVSFLSFFGRCTCFWILGCTSFTCVHENEEKKTKNWLPIQSH